MQDIWYATPKGTATDPQVENCYSRVIEGAQSLSVQGGNLFASPVMQLPLR